MRWLPILILPFICLIANAQCKTFRITSKGDTLNCTDSKDLKQGKWKIHVDPIRGNPGYDQEGEFVDGRKEGVWRTYSTMGDLLSIENFKWGNHDGLSQFFTVAGLEHEENWRASNPESLYDTVQVVDPAKPNQYVTVIVKNEGRSKKHGTWKWYRPGSLSIYRVEVYVLDKLQLPANADNGSGSDSTASKTPAKKVVPKEVTDFEKKNAGKKKLRDGATGGM
jgi:hypothetical protein